MNFAHHIAMHADICSGRQIEASDFEQSRLLAPRKPLARRGLGLELLKCLYSRGFAFEPAPSSLSASFPLIPVARR